MTFIGSDGSVLDWEDYDFRLYYGKKEGLMFKDIAYSPSISMVENLYICGLRDSKIEALVSRSNLCDFSIISQAQKRANFLEDSINEIKAEIHRIVTK